MHETNAQNIAPRPFFVRKSVAMASRDCINTVVTIERWIWNGKHVLDHRETVRYRYLTLVEWLASEVEKNFSFVLRSQWPKIKICQRRTRQQESNKDEKWAVAVNENLRGEKQEPAQRVHCRIGISEDPVFWLKCRGYNKQNQENEDDDKLGSLENIDRRRQRAIPIN